MRRTISILLGLGMLGLALYVLGRPLVGGGAPVTSSRGLDLAFAAFFGLRGGMYLWRARRPAAGPPTRPAT
jgi:hypothetical protein